MNKLLIKHGMVYDALNPEPSTLDILSVNGKIAEISRDIKVDDAEVVDATGLRVYPGFVEAHCHLGLSQYGHPGRDYNEKTDPITPQLRAIDAIDGKDPYFMRAAMAGITTITTGPGSSNVLGGTFVALKPRSFEVEKMILRDPVAMKCAFGENPRNSYQAKSIASRMSIAGLLREALFKARDYMLKREISESGKGPSFDMKSEALIPVLKGEIPLKAHAHQINDILTAIRIAREFDVKLTLEHCTQGHLIAETLAEAGYPVAVGPTMSSISKSEVCEKSFSAPGILHRAGCQVSIITDSNVTEINYLALTAGLAIREGLPPFAALQAITINPAKHIGLSDRIGSLEAGKDADILICTHDPIMDYLRNKIKYVFIDGISVELQDQ